MVIPAGDGSRSVVSLLTHELQFVAAPLSATGRYRGAPVSMAFSFCAAPQLRLSGGPVMLGFAELRAAIEEELASSNHDASNVRRQ